MSKFCLRVHKSGYRVHIPLSMLRSHILPLHVYFVSIVLLKCPRPWSSPKCPLEWQKSRKWADRSENCGNANDYYKTCSGMPVEHRQVKVNITVQAEIRQAEYLLHTRDPTRLYGTYSMQSRGLVNRESVPKIVRKWARIEQPNYGCRGCRIQSH